MNDLDEVTKLADRLAPAEQLELVEHLARRLRSQAGSNRTPIDLYGTWKGKFPEEIDVASDIRGIRNGGS